MSIFNLPSGNNACLQQVSDSLDLECVATIIHCECDVLFFRYNTTEMTNGDIVRNDDGRTQATKAIREIFHKGTQAICWITSAIFIVKYPVLPMTVNGVWSL